MRLELLRKYYVMAEHNLFCYSKDYTTTEAKPHYEKQWKDAKREMEILEVMIKELPKENDEECMFIGSISSMNIEVSKINNESYIENLIILCKDNIRRMFKIDYFVGKELLESYDLERHKRYEKSIDTDMVFTVDNFSQKIIKWDWRISNYSQL